MYFVRAAAVRTSSKKQKYAIWDTPIKEIFHISQGERDTLISIMLYEEEEAQMSF